MCLFPVKETLSHLFALFALRSYLQPVTKHRGKIRGKFMNRSVNRNWQAVCQFISYWRITSSWKQFIKNSDIRSLTMGRSVLLFWVTAELEGSGQTNVNKLVQVKITSQERKRFCSQLCREMTCLLIMGTKFDAILIEKGRTSMLEWKWWTGGCGLLCYIGTKISTKENSV